MRIPINHSTDTATAGKPASTTKTFSFSNDILPLFRPSDIQHMNAFGVRLGDHGWMSKPTNARNVLNHLKGTSQPRMPLGGPYWIQEQLNIFQQWMGAGYPP
jgi:hypothetical protein